MNQVEKIKFRQLSWPLKLAAIGGFGTFIMFSIGFVIGFLEGLLGV